MRTAAGAARYKQPIGSIIVMRGGGKKDLNLSHMDENHLTELMEDSAARDKNPDVYEAAFTEWSRRQTDVEPVHAPYPDPWDEQDVSGSDRLDMVAAERDASLSRLVGEAHETDDEFQQDLDRYEVYTALLEHEQKIAATQLGEQVGTTDVVEAPRPDGDVNVEVSDSQRRKWAIMEEADQLSQSKGISYEQALGEVQGLDPDQVYRREFVSRGRELGYASTSFKGLIDETHLDYQRAMELEMEEATRGHFIAREFSGSEEFWKKWNEEEKSLFSMTDAEARKYMSPEALQFLDDVGGRVTKTDLVGMVEDGTLSENFEPESIQSAYQSWRGRRMRDYLQ